MSFGGIHPGMIAALAARDDANHAWSVVEGMLNRLYNRGNALLGFNKKNVTPFESIAWQAADSFAEMVVGRSVLKKNPAISMETLVHWRRRYTCVFAMTVKYLLHVYGFAPSLVKKNPEVARRVQQKLLDSEKDETTMPRFTREEWEMLRNLAHAGLLSYIANYPEEAIENGIAGEKFVEVWETVKDMRRRNKGRWSDETAPPFTPIHARIMDLAEELRSFIDARNGWRAETGDWAHVPDDMSLIDKFWTTFTERNLGETAVETKLLEPADFRQFYE